MCLFESPSPTQFATATLPRTFLRAKKGVCCAVQHAEVALYFTIVIGALSIAIAVWILWGRQSR